MRKFNVIKNKTCRMCSCTKFHEVINIGMHPLVNSLISKKDLKQKDPVFPIKVRQCKRCKLVQLTEIIDSNEIYKNVDYLYFSSDMPALDKYFLPYAKEIKKRFLKKKDFVVEIGSNDGVMLKYFKKYKHLGVDPATNVVIRALRNKIDTLPLFFTKNLANKILREYGPAKVIYGNNCIAHLDGLRDLTSGVYDLLDKNGVFIIECNYWGGMVDKTNYSLIYHDHYSYFSLKVWMNFAKKYNLKVFDATVTPAQGGSLRLFLSKNNRKMTKRCKKLLNEENTSNLNSFEVSKKYRESVLSTSKDLKNLVTKLKKRKKKIAGYGAAAKGMTILKCSGIGKELSYFVDDSPAKQGLYSPVDHVPIISRKKAQKNLPDYFIILAPNYSEVIISKEKKFIKNGGKFIVPKNGIHVTPS